MNKLVVMFAAFVIAITGEAIAKPTASISAKMVTITGPINVSGATGATRS